MDVESKQTIDEAVDRAKAAGDEIVDRARAAVNDAVGTATGKLDALAKNATEHLEDILHDVIDRVSAEVSHTLDSLDGWTVTINVPAITIRLNAPKAK